MKYTLEQNLDSRKGVASNLHGFIERYMDTGFKSKWSGYWSPPYKFLDYYAFKLNGVWLGPETLNATEYGESFAYHHETDSLQIRENLKLPESHPGFKVELKIQNRTEEKKAVQIGLELGLDIRRKDQDIGPEDYNIEKNSGRVTFSSDDKKLVLSTKDEVKIEGNKHVKEHYPDDRQRAVVPGQLTIRKELEPNGSKTLELDFSTTEVSFGKLDGTDSRMEGDLSRCFNYCIDSMENLVYDREGKGIIAGHPWFQSYWARDSLISVLGLVDAGHFELSREILENFAEENLTGKINLDGTTEKTGREDHYPLYILTSEKLKNHDSISKKIEEARKEAMKNLDIKNGVVQHDPSGTWMDTIEREEAIDIQSLWLEAADIMDDYRVKELEKGMKNFVKEDKVVDELGEPKNTFNVIVPVIFGHFDDKVAQKVMERINGEFISQYGMRTRSAMDPGYESDGYHTGSVWGLTTALGAAANFKVGNNTQGLNLLKKMEKFLDQNQVGALPEVVDAETGESLGCSEQAWSAAMFVHAIDSYLLDEKDGVPQSFSAKRTNKRIDGEKLEITSSEGEINVEEM
ncbi:MAG: hypothetical protein H8Z69_01885 [Nanohaloarchaea archaeon]|nr:hypothetical protein [Candidatus Nanohaloarchaea archaeon]